MIFLTGANPVTQCAGQNHRFITGTVGGISRVLTVVRADMQLDPADRELYLIARVRSALKEGGATLTLASWNNILGNRSLHI
jgi:hypothetical protein